MMKQINQGGTNYQVQTGENNTNYFYPPLPEHKEPKSFTVPYERNLHFTGRTEVLAQIHETLGQTGTAALNQAKAISGLGGVGKTQTAIEYAYRYFHDQPFYQWVFWVNASDLTLAASFGSIATDLALPNHETQKLDEQIATVSRWLETHNRWLLIFDNLDDPQSLKPFRPKNPEGRILITSRAQRFDSLGVAYPIALNAMTAAEAHQFLLHRTERIKSPLNPPLVGDFQQSEVSHSWGVGEQFVSLEAGEQQAVEALAAALGYLPLALEQAAAYIVAKGVSFAAYLRSYEKRRLQLLEKQQPQAGNYPHSVVTTWAINFEAVKTNSPAAADLLNLSAFLSPDNIPYELLALGKDHLGESLSAALAEATEDELVIPELLEELTRYSLIQPEATDCYSIHRMVQEVLRDGMDEATRLAWLGWAVEALNAAFPVVEFETWQQCARLVEHGQAIERHLEQIPYHTVSAARLLNNAGYYLHEQGRYSEAEPLCLKTLSIREQLLGANHPDVALSLNNLASLYYSKGDYRKAKPLCLRALSIREQMLGENHPDVAQSLNNLASLYKAEGDYRKAEPLYLRALSVREQQLGTSHPHVALSLNNLAELYRAQGHYEKAEPLLLRALSIWEQQLDTNHPDVAQSLDILAELYRAQGHYEKAEPLLLRALSIWEQQLGVSHPHVALSLNTLTELYRAQGHYRKGEPLLLRALSIREQHLGMNHPGVAITLSNLALLYKSEGRYGEAEPLYLRALSIWKQQLGAKYPDVATTFNNLAALYEAQERYREAEPLYARALHLSEEILGIAHPTTMIIRQNYADCLRAMNDRTIFRVKFLVP